MTSSETRPESPTPSTTPLRSTDQPVMDALRRLCRIAVRDDKLQRALAAEQKSAPQS